MEDLAPILLFVYNRPLHTEQTLEALSKNLHADRSILYIYADGIKENATEDEKLRINQVLVVLKKKQWCKEVLIHTRNNNWGLAKNVINGVTACLNKHESVIVLEDDLITSPYFLDYCNQGLKIYKEEKNVYSVNGFQFPLNIKENDTFLCPLATSSWGWATWADRWQDFDTSLKYKEVIQNNHYLRQRFNIADYDYSTMLSNNNSWAIKWYYSAFLKNGLGLFPTNSLVYNIGFDGSGTHESNRVLQTFYKEKIIVQKKSIINLEHYSKLLNYFKASEPKSVTNRIYNWGKKWLNL